METLKNNTNREVFENEMSKYIDSFSEFEQMEKDALKELSFEELKQMRQIVKDEKMELSKLKTQRNVELIMIGTLLFSSFYFGTKTEFIKIIFPMASLGIILFTLNKTLNRIKYLNFSILSFGYVETF